MTDAELAEALIAALATLAREGGAPDTMIDGNNGEYIILNGEVTEYGIQVLTRDEKSASQT